MTTYRSLFAVAEFRTLFLVRLCEMVGIVVSSLAVGTVVYAQTDSPILTAIAMFGGPLVQLITSHYLLAGSDLLRPRTAIMLVGIVAAATDLLQLIPGLTWPARFGLVAVTYLVVAATGGSSIALLSDIVPPDAFVLARSTLNIAVGGMQILGNAVGALLLLAFAPVQLFLISGLGTLLAVVVTRIGLGDHPARARGPIAARTRSVNKILLGSATIRPIYLMMCIPNGLIVGCEAIYIPFARTHAGYLFAATAAGMLAGDITVGRFVPAALRDRLIVPLRLVLAVPFLIMLLHPSIPVSVVVVAIAGVGYVAALPLQERLIQHVDPDAEGQAFALASTAVLIGKSLGALLAGILASKIGAAAAMGTVAAMSLITTGLIGPGLRRSKLTEPRAAE